MNGISLRRIDWAMLGTILILIGLSAAFVYSAQFKSDVEVGSNWMKQLVFAGMGLVAYGVLTWFDYGKIATLSLWIYGGVIILLLLVFLFPSVNGAHRWIPLPGFTLQPSELGKLGAIIALAAYLAVPGRDMDNWKTFISCGAIVGLPFLLIAAEPDLSTSLTLAPITLAIMLYMGVQRKLLLIGLAVVLLLSVVICFWIVNEKPAEGEPASKWAVLPPMPLLADYQKGRIKVF